MSMGTPGSEPKPAAPPRRRQEDRSRETRDALIAAAIDCIAEQGYVQTTTTRIARRAGVSRGALQHHFGSRDDLVEAVIDRVMGELHFAIDVETVAALPLDRRVDIVVDNYQRVFGGRLFIAALNIWLGVIAEPALRDRMHGRLREAQVRFRSLWSAIFHDTALAEQQLMQVRRIVMATSRGYAIHQLFGAPSGNWTDDGAMLKQAVVSMLSGKPADR